MSEGPKRGPLLNVFIIGTMSSRIKLLAFDRACAADLIRLALPMSLTEFAARHGFSKQEVSQCLYRYRRHEKVRDALAGALGVSRAEIDELLDGARTRSDASEPAA